MGDDDVVKEPVVSYRMVMDKKVNGRPVYAEQGGGACYWTGTPEETKAMGIPNPEAAYHWICQKGKNGAEMNIITDMTKLGLPKEGMAPAGMNTNMQPKEWRDTKKGNFADYATKCSSGDGEQQKPEGCNMYCKAEAETCMMKAKKMVKPPADMKGFVHTCTK